MFRTLFIQLYVGIFKHTQCCEAHSCTASDTLKNSGIFRTLFIQLYAGIFKHTQRYEAHSRILKYIQAYSGIFRTLCNPCIFTTLPYSEPWHI